MTTAREPAAEIRFEPSLPVATRWRTLGLALRAVQVRLRFVIILVVALLVAGQWETLRNYADKILRVAFGAGNPHGHAVSADTEYFCPMDPGVVSEWPGKCGTCNMGLVRRKLGDSAPLPSGVVARMQFSPYRVQLAGIRTASATYQPLGRDLVLVGAVAESASRCLVEADFLERDRAFVTLGQVVEVSAIEGTGGQTVAGTVRDVLSGNASHRPRVMVEVDLAAATLSLGMPVKVKLRRPIAELEPFRSLPADPPPLRNGGPRAVYLCPEHPSVLSDRRGKCPVDSRDDLERQALLDNQRVGWWCPLHPQVSADRAGHDCPECGGMTLVTRIITYRPQGQVLTVPESAVVDTGTRTVVYVERMPGLFDGVAVALGPRCGDSYPVVSGLEPGQRVATAGAFLLDAETRLNPGLAASYFGSGRVARGEAGQSESTGPLSDLSVKDQALAARQQVCPVTRKPLGSMGTPVRIEVAGKAVWICCAGCAEKVRKAPEKYLPQ